MDITIDSTILPDHVSEIETTASQGFPLNASTTQILDELTKSTIEQNSSLVPPAPVTEYVTPNTTDDSTGSFVEFYNVSFEVMEVKGKWKNGNTCLKCVSYLTSFIARLTDQHKSLECKGGY